MGLFMDTLSYATHIQTSASSKDEYIIKDKTIQFIIPFEKNKSEYKEEDVKPIYDTLNLTDYNIRKLTIRAYSSVEGSESRNLELQEKRAQSIVDILQTYQTPTIITDVKASENWVEFLNDISNSPFSYLTQLSKAEIKEKLEEKKTLEDLEPFLSKHRKAILTIHLQKKDRYTHLEPEQLIQVFSKTIDEGKADEALNIQKAILQKIIANEMPSKFLTDIDIPEKQEYSVLLTSQTAFKYFLNETDALKTYGEFEKLENLFPQDGNIKYNLCALKFRIWLLGEQAIDPKQFESEIRKLNSYKIPYILVQRMLINFNIIMSEYYMIQNDYAAKDRCLNFIKQNYRSISMTDADLLSLAQYFSSYARYDWAESMLKPKMNEINVDEDLLFYYLNLTLIDNDLIKKPAYRTIMLNAINANRERYCKLFDPFGKGGITFQLLENEMLKKTYCENCQE